MTAPPEDRNCAYNSLLSLFPRILVHEVPYRKRVKSIRMRLWRPVFGIVRIAGQVRPLRQSSGTQNKSPSGPRTHPFESSRSDGIGRPEKTFRGGRLDESLNPEATLRPSDKNGVILRSYLTLETHLDLCVIAYSKFESCCHWS